ncbi:MAG: tyrosine-type recombinase/integrase [Candidatus Freyarchaeota archaeon]
MQTLETANLDWLEIISKNEKTAVCRVSKGKNGYPFRNPVFIEVPIEVDRITYAVFNYIYEGLSRMPKLMEFVFQNKSMLNVADYLYRHKTQSRGTLLVYTYWIKRYCDYLGKTPDQLIAECYDPEGFPDSKILYRHAEQLDNYITELQLDGLAPLTIGNTRKSVQALYITNKLKLNYPYKISVRVVNRDRAPTPEELQTLMDLGDPRERVIISCLALGGFREGTLAKLKLYHIQEDLEKGIVPIHVHVEAEITKGKYHDYDTFLGREAVDCIKAYLKIRERGSLKGGIPPEELTPEAPLIRNQRVAEVKPVNTNQIYMLIHGLYHKAGLLKKRMGRLYDLRPHSIRKYFRTQLASLGVSSDYIEYMMGHKVPTYHDIQMKGVEFLRNIYSASGFSIKPQTKYTEMNILKSLITNIGTLEDLQTIADHIAHRIQQLKSKVEPHRTIIIDQKTREEIEIQELRKALKRIIKREILSEENPRV